MTAKRVIPAIILIMMLILSVLPMEAPVVNAAVSSGTCGAQGDNLRWTFDYSTGLLTISGTGDMYDYRLQDSGSGGVFPPWYTTSMTVKKIIIEEGVTSIGDGAFRNNDVRSVVIANSVRTIGVMAFYNARSLSSIEGGDGVINIGTNAFSDTPYYQYSSNWENNVFYFAKCLVAANSSVEGDYKIKEGTKAISSYAFSYCGKITKVIIPDSVNTIGNMAFYYCSGLSVIEGGNNIISVGNNAFYNTPFYENPSNWKNGAFYISDCLVNADKVEGSEYIIEEGTKRISENAFWGLETLTSIVIPDSVSYIGENAFYGTGYYNDSSNWENGVLYVSNHLIKAQNTVGDVYTIKDGTVNIAVKAFSGCEELTAVSIPDSVISIDDFAFEECSELKGVIFGSGIKSIGCSAFNYGSGSVHFHYRGNSRKWSKILIDEGNTSLYDTIVYCDYTGDGFEVQYTPATCTENGGGGLYCSECDLMLDSYVIPLFGHSYSGGVCLNCGYDSALIESIHPYDNNSDITQSIVRNGIKWMKLTFSDNTELEEPIDGEIYDYVCIYDGQDNLIGKYSGKELAGQVVAVTGNTAKIRLVSDSSYNYYGYAVVNVEYFYDECAHENAKKSGYIAPDCDTAGRTGTFYCTDCQKKASDEVIPPLGHTFENSICTVCGNHCQHRYRGEVTPPSCTENGYTLYTCEECGASHTGDITVPAHSYSPVITSPTCTENGYTTWICGVCGDSYIDSETPAGHDYKAFVTAPTCTEEGYTVHTCQVCGGSYTDSYVEIVRHNYVSDVCSYCGREKTVVSGDVNDDGRINSKDLMQLKRYFADAKNIFVLFENADVNGDGKINSRDIIALKRIMART